MMGQIATWAGIVLCFGVGFACVCLGVAWLCAAVANWRDRSLIHWMIQRAWSVDRWCAHDEKVSATARFMAYCGNEMLGKKKRNRNSVAGKEMEAWSSCGSLSESEFRKSVCPPNKEPTP